MGRGREDSLKNMAGCEARGTGKNKKNYRQGVG